MLLTGECFCGSIRYRISGPLTDARSCHCSRCRKAFSAQASAYALVNPADFEWLSGEQLLTAYFNKDGHGLKFCSCCGSTLCGVVDGQIHGITLGCLNDDPKLEIQRHIYAGSRARWEVMPEGVVQYDEDVPESSG